MPAPLLIDAHQHVWDRARADYRWLDSAPAALDRTHPFAEALPAMRAAGVRGTVLVQAADDERETAFLRAVAAAHPQVVGIVAYAPLDDPAALEGMLDDLATDPLVVGVRDLGHDHPDPDRLRDPRIRRSVALVAGAGLALDVVALHDRHLRAAIALAETTPGLRLVLDHLAAPPVDGDDRTWRDGIAAAAALPGVAAKVSGLQPRDEPRDRWTVDALRPAFETALASFGADRLMLGSDWPVSTLSFDLESTWTRLRAVVADLRPEDRAAVEGGSAQRVYRLSPELLAALP